MDEEKTYAQSLQTFIPDAVHRLKIQDAVQRMHRIKMIGTELFLVHIHRCLDERIQLPNINQTWLTQLFNIVNVPSCIQILIKGVSDCPI